MISLIACAPQVAHASYSFSAPVIVSNGDNSVSPRIFSSGNNVYVSWLDTDASQVLFATSTNGGTLFTASAFVTPSTNALLPPQFAVSGSFVYMVWVDTTNTNNEIFFAKSTDGGSHFGAHVALSNGVDSATKPQIAVSGTNVYVAWEDTTTAPGAKSDIYFVRSTDNGLSFGSVVNLSANAGPSNDLQMVASGTNLYVVWNDNTSGNKEILYEKSSDSGNIFNLGTPTTPGAPLNLSNTANASTFPQIAVSGTNVYVVWDEFDTTVNFDRAFFVGSTDGGDTFGSSTNLSANSPAGSGQSSAISPQIATSGNNVYVIWQDHVTSPAPNTEIFYERSTDNGATFNAGTSGIPGAPTNLSNDNVASNSQQITASGSNVYVIWSDDASPPNLWSKTSTDGGNSFPDIHNVDTNVGQTLLNSPQISLSNLTPNVVWIDDSSTVTSDVYFSSGTPSSIIISFDASQYKIGSTATVTVYDPAGGTSISSVNIKSNSDTTGLTTSFSQTTTHVYSGQVIFTTGPTMGSSLHVSPGDTITVSYGGGTGNAKIFPRTISFDQASYFTNSNVRITVLDENSNTNTGLAETIPVTITTTSGFSSILNFPETGPDTGIFVNPSGTSLPLHAGNTITATYLGVTTNAIVTTGTSPGGGGGGLIRPGLVLDILVGAGAGDTSPPSYTFDKSSLDTLSLPDDIKTSIENQDPSKPLMPITNAQFDLPVTFGNQGFAVQSYTSKIPTITEDTGIPSQLKLVMHNGRHEITHVALYTNLRGTDREIQNSDTYIIYEKGQPLQIVDPHGLFSSVTITPTANDVKQEFDYSITFAKPMDTSDIIVRSWNEVKASDDMKLEDAWKVVSSSNDVSQSANKAVANNLQPSLTTTENISPNQQNEKPSLVTGNAVDILPQIKDWGGYSPNPISDSDLLKSIGINDAHSIPSWFMKTSKWVVDGEMTQQEFIDAIKYMHENGMIK